MKLFKQQDMYTFNQNDYLIYIGRLATLSGIIGLIVGLISAFILNFSTIGIILFTALMTYLFLTGFWGIHNLDRWFRKYRYRMPIYLWWFFRIIVIMLGAVIGVMFWGAFEHFILLLAMGGSGKPGMIASQIILIPGIGLQYARKLNYDPSAQEHIFKT